MWRNGLTEILSRRLTVEPPNPDLLALHGEAVHSDRFSGVQPRHPRSELSPIRS